MSNNIVQIDIEKLDNEIIELENKVDILKAELEIKISLRKYIELLADSQSISSAAVLSTTDNFIKPQQSVSEYILSLLSDNVGDTSFVIKSYANYLGVEENKVSNNVYNALSRLKDKGKIKNEKDGGRGVWIKN